MVVQPFFMPPPPRPAGRVWRRLCLLLSCVLVLGRCTPGDEAPTAPAGADPDGTRALIVTVAAPIALAVEADGALVVVDERLRAVVRVDPATGDHSLVSELGRGAGPSVGFPGSIAVAPDGALLVTYNGFEVGAVVRVHPTTGDRTVLSGCATVDPATFSCLTLLGAGPPLHFPSGIAVEADGALVVIDGTAVVRVDPATGDRTMLSGCAVPASDSGECSALLGAGPPLHFPSGIAVEAEGTLVVIDGTAVVRVDPATGDRTVLSGCAVPAADPGACSALLGAGPPLRAPRRITVEAEGTLVVTDGTAVVRVDSATGDRTVLSGCTANVFPCPALLGAGPPLRFPTGITVEADGTLVVTDGESFGAGAVVRVDPTTGDRMVLAEARTTRIGAGPALRFPTGIAVEADGTLLVTDGESLGLGAVVRVDPVTGDRTVLSGCTAMDPVTFSCPTLLGAGPPLRSPTGLAVEAGGAIVVADAVAGVVRIDPSTGDRTVLSGCSAVDAESSCSASDIGAGPSLQLPTSIAVLPDGALVVTDDTSMFVGNTGAVMHVHPVTGDRTVLSSCVAPAPDSTNSGKCSVLLGAGPPLAFFTRGGIAVEAEGTLVVADTASGVVRVDPSTGDRTVLSGCAARAFPCPAPRGAGPHLGRLTSIAVAPDGALVVGDDVGKGRLLEVHPGTGDRVLVSGFDREANASRGSGPLLLWPAGIVVEADGALIVVDTLLRAVVRVDPLTGNHTIISR